MNSQVVALVYDVKKNCRFDQVIKFYLSVKKNMNMCLFVSIATPSSVVKDVEFKVD